MTRAVRGAPTRPCSVSCAIRCAAVTGVARRLLAVAERLPSRSAREYLLFFLRCPGAKCSAGVSRSENGFANAEDMFVGLPSCSGCTRRTPGTLRYRTPSQLHDACASGKTFREGVVQPTETTPPGRLRSRRKSGVLMASPLERHASVTSGRKKSLCLSHKCPKHGLR